MHQQQRWREIDYYAVLGLTQSASASEIKSAYRKLALQKHPDKDGGDDEAFKELNEAHQVLGDAKKRAQYDHYRTHFKSHPHDVSYRPPPDPELRDMAWCTSHAAVQRLWRALLLSGLVYFALLTLSVHVSVPLLVVAPVLIEIVLLVRVRLPGVRLLLFTIAHFVVALVVSTLLPRALLEMLAHLGLLAVLVASSQVRVLAVDAAVALLLGFAALVRVLLVTRVLVPPVGRWWALLSAHSVVAAAVALVIIALEALALDRYEQRPQLRSYATLLLQHVPAPLRTRIWLNLIWPLYLLSSFLLLGFEVLTLLFTSVKGSIARWIAAGEESAAGHARPRFPAAWSHRR